MQDKAKKNKKKRALVYKPYKKGVCCSGVAARKGIRILVYYFLFAFLYLMLGATLQFDQAFLRIICNALLVIICVMLMYMEGARMGEGEVALGEISLVREQSGKSVSPDDVVRCYHPGKGWFICLIGVLPLLVLTVPHAVMAQKQVYMLQALPSWVTAYQAHEEISQPLAYYAAQATPIGVQDILRIIVRVLIFPFANMVTSDNSEGMLLIDRLSPLLAALPALGFPLGYATGPLARAMVHGDIKSANKRHQRKVRKAIKERQARSAKKKEII